MIIRIPATSANLGAGFDTLGLALGLYNEFRITPSIVQGIKIDGEGGKIPRLLKDNNFVKIFKEAYISLGGDKNDNFSFHLQNNIPISRGLGSSSAVIVGALVAAHCALNISYKKDEILNRALRYEKHPDNITPAVNGGFNIAMVKNNRIYFTKTKIADDIKAVIVVPNKPISTKHSRKFLNKEIPLNDCVFNIARSSMISGIFMQKKWHLLKSVGDDKLHQEIRMKMLPMLFNVRKEAIKNGALLSVLSGSGSSFLNICYRDDCARIATRLKEKFGECRILELEFDNNGIDIA